MTIFKKNKLFYFLLIFIVISFVLGVFTYFLINSSIKVEIINNYTNLLNNLKRGDISSFNFTQDLFLYLIIWLFGISIIGIPIILFFFFLKIYIFSLEFILIIFNIKNIFNIFSFVYILF